MQSAIGRARLVLGHDGDGMFCHAVLRVTSNPTGNDPKITRAAECNDIGHDVHERCLDYLQTWVDSYWTKRTIGLSIEILELHTDPVRNNDYERGLNLAMRDALEQLGLPAPQIFSL